MSFDVHFDGYIKSMGFTDQQVADDLGCTKSYVGMLRTGKREASPDLLRRIYTWAKGALSSDVLLGLDNIPPSGVITEVNRS